MPDALVQLWNRIADIPHLGLYVSIGWALYLVLLAGWIVLQKREPAATLSWVLSLAALPYLGFVIYFLLGPQRIRRQRMKRIRARSRLSRAEVSVGRDRLDECVKLSLLARASTGLEPSAALRPTLLENGAQTFPALLEAIAAATHHVHLAYYIFEPDRTGTALRDALIERARAGVRVRLLLDGVGSGRASNRFLKPLKEAGGEVAWFHPFRVRLLRRPKINLRSHRKIVVVDGRIGFTGGINITDDQDERINPAAYRDLHLRFEGEAVRGLQLTFLEDWVYAARVALRDERLWPELPRGGVPALILPSGPDSPWESIHRLHVEALHQAEQRAWLMTPYFVPGEAARFAITSAALRGVDVRVLVPHRSDSRIVTAAARSYYDELFAAGVRVFEYRPGMLHSKALLVDHDIVLLGSANFDNRSFRVNFELSVLIHDTGIASALERVWDGYMPDSVEIHADRRRAAWWRRLAEAFARLLSPLL